MRSEQSVGHAEEKRIETSNAIRPMRAEEEILIEAKSK